MRLNKFLFAIIALAIIFFIIIYYDSEFNFGNKVCENNESLSLTWNEVFNYYNIKNYYMKDQKNYMIKYEVFLSEIKGNITVIESYDKLNMTDTHYYIYEDICVYDIYSNSSEPSFNPFAYNDCLIEDEKVKDIKKANLTQKDFLLPKNCTLRDSIKR